MANITKVKVRDLKTPVDYKYGRFANNAVTRTREEEYRNLLANEVSIINKATRKPIAFADETFAKNALIDGQVGYDKITKKFYHVYGIGRDGYGNPTSLNFVADNGRTLVRKAYYANDDDGAYLIKAMPFGYSFNDLIKKATDFIKEAETAISLCKFL